MPGCDSYVCMGCGKCYGLSPKGRLGEDVCLICGMLLEGDSRCPHCGSPVVKPLETGHSAATCDERESEAEDAALLAFA